MIGPRAGTRVWLAAGVTDMRCGMDTLAAKVQTALTEDPYSGHVFVFRGRRGDLVKLLWSDGDGMCLLARSWSSCHGPASLASCNATVATRACARCLASSSSAPWHSRN